jgi:hypothetical protein
MIERLFTTIPLPLWLFVVMVIYIALTHAYFTYQLVKALAKFGSPVTLIRSLGFRFGRVFAPKTNQYYRKDEYKKNGKSQSPQIHSSQPKDIITNKPSYGSHNQCPQYPQNDISNNLRHADTISHAKTDNNQKRS